MECFQEQIRQFRGGWHSRPRQCIVQKPTAAQKIGDGTAVAEANLRSVDPPPIN